VLLFRRITREVSIRVVVLSIATVVVLAGRTHASISSIPLEIEGFGTVYRYQGRANFSQQVAEANRMITVDYKAKHGGRPVIVDLKKRDLGIVLMNTSQSTNRINASATGSALRYKRDRHSDHYVIRWHDGFSRFQSRDSL